MSTTPPPNAAASAAPVTTETKKRDHPDDDKSQKPPAKRSLSSDEDCLDKNDFDFGELEQGEEESNGSDVGSTVKVFCVNPDGRSGKISCAIVCCLGTGCDQPLGDIMFAKKDKPQKVEFQSIMGNQFVKRIFTACHNNAPFENDRGCPHRGMCFPLNIPTKEALNTMLKSKFHATLPCIAECGVEANNLPLVKEESDIVRVDKLGDVIRNGDDLLQILYKRFPDSLKRNQWAKAKNGVFLHREFDEGTVPPDFVHKLKIPQACLKQKDRENHTQCIELLNKLKAEKLKNKKEQKDQSDASKQAGQNLAWFLKQVATHNPSASTSAAAPAQSQSSTVGT